MSRTITIAVDLDKDNAALQIEEGIKTLKLMQSTTTPMLTKDGVVGEDTQAAIVEKTEVPAAPAATTETASTPAPPAPPAPPAATIETPEVPEETAAPKVVDVDSEGLPWDGRIHASSKTKLVKGDTWKLKRGVKQELVDEVKAELKATMAAPAATTEEPDPKAVFGEVTDTPAPPELPETPMQFPELMQIITERLANQTLQQTDLDTILLAHEIPSVGMLASRPDIIPEIAEELEAV